MAFTLWNLLKASLLFTNGIAVLHRRRFLGKYGLDTVEGDPSSVKTQMVGLLNAIQYLKVPLVVLNIIVVAIELVFGG